MKRDPWTRLASELPAGALDRVRLPGGGERPRVRPAGPEALDQLRATLALARGEGWTVLPAGNGTRWAWGAPPEAADLVLSTGGLDRIVAYEPGDGTLTAEAGCTFEDLGALLAADGFHLSPEVARPGSSTLGGVLAAGVSGFDRLRHGPARHHVLGLRVLQADGALTKTGGRLVKNVTGYDLQRLYCGSRGTLCVILEATLRLFPAPDVRVALRAIAADSDELLERADAVARTSVVPFAVVARTLAPGDPRWQLIVFLGARADVLPAAEERLVAALGPMQREEGEAERALRAFLRDAEEPAAEERGWELSLPRARLRAALATLADPARAADARGLLCHPLLGRLTVRQPAADAAGCAALEERLAACGGVLRLRHPAPAAGAPGGAPAPLARELMEGLKHTLDPGGLFPTPVFP